MSTAAPFAVSLHDRIGDALAQLVALLAVPVLLMAIAALLACAVELGRFVTEAWQRRARRRESPLRTLAARAVAAPGEAAQLSLRAPTAITAVTVRQLAAAVSANRPEAAEQALADFELAVQRRLDRTRLLVRAGPAIGLMGTLIPLAPGLAALSDGNISKLAEDLRVAFAATVVGLLVGTTAFALTLVRTRMYTEDLIALEQAAARVPDAAAAPAVPPAPPAQAVAS